MALAFIWLTAAKGGAFIIKCGAAVTRSYFRRQVQVNRWLRASKTCAADLHWFVHFPLYFDLFRTGRAWLTHSGGVRHKRNMNSVCVVFFCLFFSNRIVSHPPFQVSWLTCRQLLMTCRYNFLCDSFVPFVALCRGRAPCRLTTLIAAQPSIHDNLCKFQVSNHQIIVKANQFSATAVDKYANFDLITKVSNGNLNHLT